MPLSVKRKSCTIFSIVPAERSSARRGMAETPEETARAGGRGRGEASSRALAERKEPQPPGASEV